MAPNATHGLTDAVLATGAGADTGAAATAPVVTDINEKPTASAVNLRSDPDIFALPCFVEPPSSAIIRQHLKRCNTIEVASSSWINFHPKKRQISDVSP